MRFVSDLGLGFWMFLAGFEIDLRLLKPPGGRSSQ
jgi:Kef-type K+ transport system membrane component KefB